MSLVINGKTYKTVYLNGKEYSRGYFNGKLVFTRAPDNNSYLYAGSGVRLAADGTSAVSYLNTPRVISNTLSNQTLGSSPFELQFDVHSKAITHGTTQIFNAGGLMRCFAQGGTLHFKFAWDNAVYELDKKYLKEGWNTVILSSTGKIISLQVNEYVAILVDTTKKVPILDYTPHSASVSSEYVTNTSGGYISINNLDNLNLGAASTWSIGASFVYTTGDASYDGIYGSYDDYKVPELNINIGKNKLYVHLSSDGSSRDIVDGWEANYTLNKGSRYWTILSFTGTSYELSISADGIEYQTYTIASTSTRVASVTNPAMIFMNRRVGNGQNAWLKGPLYTSYTDTYIIADGVEYGRTYSYPITYPQLTVGQISSQVDWTKVRNIKAIIL